MASCRVVGGIEVEKTNVNNPDPVEVDDEMAIRTLLEIGLEEYPVPVYPVELDETL